MKRQQKTPFEKHATHPTEIRIMVTGPHCAKLHCIKCNKMISWLSRSDTLKAIEIGLVTVDKALLY